jgi:hypothetical protein
VGTATSPALVSSRSKVQMVGQGERIAGGFTLITGIDGTRYAIRQRAITVIHDADECRDERWSSCMVCTSFAYPARSMKCCPGSSRRRYGPFFAARVADLGPWRPRAGRMRLRPYRTADRSDAGHRRRHARQQGARPGEPDALSRV